MRGVAGGGYMVMDGTLRGVAATRQPPRQPPTPRPWPPSWGAGPAAAPCRSRRVRPGPAHGWVTSARHGAPAAGPARAGPSPPASRRQRLPQPGQPREPLLFTVPPSSQAPRPPRPLRGFRRSAARCLGGSVASSRHSVSSSPPVGECARQPPAPPRPAAPAVAARHLLTDRVTMTPVNVALSRTGRWGSARS